MSPVEIVALVTTAATAIGAGLLWFFTRLLPKIDARRKAVAKEEKEDKSRNDELAAGYEKRMARERKEQQKILLDLIDQLRDQVNRLQTDLIQCREEGARLTERVSHNDREITKLKERIKQLEQMKCVRD